MLACGLGDRERQLSDAMRWIWIDRFLELNSGKSARAMKNLSRAEDYFAEHLPGYPVMPASLMLEGLAQTGGILVGEANGFREKVVLAKIPQAKVFREVTPGAQLIYEVEMINLRTEGALVLGRVLVGGELVIEAEIFFAHLDQSRSRQFFGDRNFVFSGELRYMLERAKLSANIPDGAV
jgi:3-hydroxyacyl-[acyl-carrier-protein] dehydratase